MAQQDEERDIQEITFFGRQDSDSALEGIQKGDFLYALNILNNSSGAGNKGIITSPKGNLQIPFALPEGENKCIGTAEDHENNRFYMFLFNGASYHGIYRFDGVSKTVTNLLLNLVDTGAVDILRFSKEYLILHADVILKDLLYWVDGLNNARKTNIRKLLDVSGAGYGDTILQSYIDAYKKTTNFAPTASYFSDETRNVNRIYGAMRKFAVRFIYDDGEKSNWSDFSNVPLPSFESFLGISSIPKINNCIKVNFETGDRTVIRIEIGMQSTSASDDVATTYQWVLIETIDKKRLSISDNSTYTYNFYNDTDYSAVASEKIIRPFSFMPKRPLCQAMAKNAITYTGGYEGTPTVDVDTEITVTTEDLFLDDEVDNELNEPAFTIESIDEDYIGGPFAFVTDINGVEVTLRQKSLPARAKKYKVTVGNDVKAGNPFQLSIASGYGPDNFTWNHIATNTDSSATVANKFRQFLIGSGRIYRQTPDMSPVNIYDSVDDGFGNISFSFIFLGSQDRPYTEGFASVTPVTFNSLKDNGVSVSNQKHGGTSKYGIVYHEDPDLRKSLAFTDENMVVSYPTINDLGGLKKFITRIQMNHKPPLWARYWSVVRSSDLTYGGFIQMLIQNVVDVNEDEAQDYIDLVVGSLFTFQKIHPNSSLQYTFEKGDVLRLIKDVDADTYYPNFETEVISYNPVVTDIIRDNLIIHGTAIVNVTAADAKNIGKFIVVNGVEREIIDAPTSTTYQLNNVIGKASEDVTYLSYELVDTRGTIRIRKPADITIVDKSTVEIFKPASKTNPLGAKQFFPFGQQFEVINPGTENAYHGGNIQNQSNSQPAIVEFSGGIAYVHSREMPINTIFPGTQMTIQPVESADYSDFYASRLNDNGRPTAEDTGDGEVHFPNRVRFSNNFIEETRINGLNDFDNTDRKDYYDDFGNIKRTVADKNNILIFKELHTGYIPLQSRITIDDSGSSLRAGSPDLLNPMQYLAYEGGIGNNPEAYCSDGTHKYTLYPNAGVVIRIGANGEEPISKTFKLNFEVRQIISDAVKNNARIFMGFNRKLSLLIITIEGYNQKIYMDGLTGWTVISDRPADGSTYEIVTPPTHGDASVAGGQITYTPDTDFIGSDSFTYRVLVAGVWSQPRKVCMNYLDTPSETGWRQKESSSYCVTEFGGITGYKGWNELEEFRIFDNQLTGQVKDNLITDPNYIAPIYDPEACTPTKLGIVVADLEGDGSIDVYAYIDTPGIPESASVSKPNNIAATGGKNIYPLASAVDKALIITSDQMTGPEDPLIKRRFQFNIETLDKKYPNKTAIPKFIYKIFARQDTAGTLQTYYSVKSVDNYMIMNGAPGTYVPNVLPNIDQPTPLPVTTYVPGGADGTIAFGMGKLIYTLEYDRATNIATLIPVSAPISCGVTAGYSGGENFPTEIPIILGAGLGTVDVTLNPIGIPDRATFEFDGVVVVDTDYRGDISYQDDLNAFLATQGLPPSTINPVYPVTISFVKSTATEIGYLKVYGPLAGTNWSVEVSCPTP